MIFRVYYTVSVLAIMVKKFSKSMQKMSLVLIFKNRSGTFLALLKLLLLEFLQYYGIQWDPTISLSVGFLLSWIFMPQN